MRPLYLEFEAFGPYVQRQRIDFAALAAHGLFLLRGETGAGKTTILDAMTYALYGKSSGGSRGDLAAMRCHTAPESTPTEVIFEFDEGGCVYRFTRRLRARHKRTGETEYLSAQDAFYRDAHGDFVPFFENPKLRSVEEKAAELIGLGYEQFRQVVILPQGQFERLLVASSEEKEQILTTLFGTERWDAAAQLIGERVNAQRKALEEQGAWLAALLRANGCENASQLAEKRAAHEAQLIAARAAFSVLSARVQAAETAHEEGQALAREFAALREAQDKIARLKAPVTVAEMDEKRKLLALRELAVQLSALQEAHKALCKAQAQTESVAAQIETLSAQREQQQSEAARLAERRAALGVLADTLPAVQVEVQEHTKRREQEAALAALGTMLEKQRETLEKAEAEERACVARSRDVLSAHLAQLSGELAAGLQSGVPCPVCGSRDHPAPAARHVSGATREEVQAANARLLRAQKAAADAAGVLEAQRAQYERDRAALQSAGGYDKTAHADCLSRLREAMAAAEEREATGQANEKLRKAEERLAADCVRAALAEKEAAACLGRAEATHGWLLEQVETLDPSGEGRARLAAHTPDQSAFDRLAQEIEKHETALQAAQEIARAQQEKLGDAVCPDVAALAAELQKLHALLLEDKGTLSVLEEVLERLAQDGKQAQKREAQYEAARAAYDADLAFSRLLRGVSGVSLGRYVLGVMLSAVTQEANRLLERVHDGRYQIYRTLETAGNVRKAGLELEVLDRQSGTRRPVVTLSGGEKFLVALALSIGLSATVQAQSGGTRLGAIFIDEGFGTLDEDSLTDALHVLAAIRDTRGMVGVISHVDLLRESIGAGIRVRKDKTGSTLETYCP